jgi:hypothetical protein
MDHFSTPRVSIATDPGRVESGRAVDKLTATEGGGSVGKGPPGPGNGRFVGGPGLLNLENQFCVQTPRTQHWPMLGGLAGLHARGVLNPETNLKAQP